MSTKIKEKFTYGYNSEQFKKFKKYAWLMLLSFGFTYLFFYNGRQNINLVMDLMKVIAICATQVWLALMKANLNMSM